MFDVPGAVPFFLEEGRDTEEGAPFTGMCAYWETPLFEFYC
jgi:hypothetical protein